MALWQLKLYDLLKYHILTLLYHQKQYRIILQKSTKASLLAFYKFSTTSHSYKSEHY